MYKIYINDRPLQLSTPEELAGVDRNDPRRLVARYSGKQKTLLNYVDMLEKASPRVEAITLYSPDLETLWHDFHTHYRLLEAAGGLVTNPAGEWLLIFRRDHWDLPKGKIDEGETPEAAAVREVEEETGLAAPELGESLGMTYHTYRDKKDRRVLKPTYWYRMYTSQTQLTPQTTEDIEQAVWMPPATFFAEERPVYGSIRELLEKAGSGQTS